MMLGTRDLRTNPRPPRSHRVWPPAPRIRSTRTADRDGRAIAISPRLPFRLQVLAREKRGNARGTADAFLESRQWHSATSTRGRRRGLNAQQRAALLSGVCANTYALSSTTVGWTSIAPTFSVGQAERDVGSPGLRHLELPCRRYRYRGLNLAQKRAVPCLSRSALRG